MRLEEPSWWYPAVGDDPAANISAQPLVARLLTPLGHAYGRITAQRMARPPRYASRHPVVCIGNLTVGGTGKTPLALTIAALLRDLDAEPWVLTRGYGGTLRGPHRVDPAIDTAAAVGDEPMLMAAAAVPVVVARDRAAGAAFIDATAPANAVVVMDDGLQNAAIAKDLTLCVVDHTRGIGNGRVFPAGPLRAPVAGQLAHVDAIVVMRGGSEPTSAETGFDATLRDGFPGPVLTASSEPVLPNGPLGPAPLIAFAGIANPDRFFATVTRAGGTIVERCRFPDHHAFSDADGRDLLARAARHGARLITTAKDHARLRDQSGARAQLAATSEVLAITTVFDARDHERLASLLRGLLLART